MSRSPYNISQASAPLEPPTYHKLRKSRGRARRQISVPEPRLENLKVMEDLRGDFRAFLERAHLVHRYSRFSLSWFQNAFANFLVFLETGADVEPDRFALRIHALDDWIAWNTQRGIAEITMNSYWRGLREKNHLF